MSGPAKLVESWKTKLSDLIEDCIFVAVGFALLIDGEDVGDHC